MSRIRIALTPGRSGKLAGLLACALFVSGFGATVSMAADSDLTPDPMSWFNEMDRYFDAHPEMKTTPGSGWKPYNRYKWFHQQRMHEGQLPPVGARWAVWQEKQKREAELPAPRATWFSLGPTNFAGRMLSMDFDPNNANVVYAGGADGGVWKTTDGGATWATTTDELPSLAIGGLAVSKTNSNVIVIATGEGTNNIDRVGGVGILRSTDAGATWVTTSLTLPVSGGHGFHIVEAGPNGTFLAGATDGLYRSSDDGATWNLIPFATAGGHWYDVKWKPGDANRCYVVRGNGSGGNNVKVSTDDGVTWTKAGNGQPLNFQIGKSRLGVSGTTIYAYIGSQSGGDITGLWVSTDDGANWTQAAASGLPTVGQQSWYNLICVADPNNASRVIVGQQSVYRSNDGGGTFSNVTGGIHVDQHDAKYESGSNTVLWTANDGGMYRNTADGAQFSWTDMNNGIVSYQFYDICTSNGSTYYTMGGTQDNGTDKWSGTTTWANGLGADGMVCNIASTSDNIVYAEIQFGDHRKSTNSGNSFFSINTGITGGGAWVTPVSLDPNNENRLFTSTSAGIFRSTDGSTWSNVASHTSTWIDISPVNGNYAWTVGGGPPYLTTDGGNTWAQSAAYGFTTGGATKILAHPTDLNSCLVTFSSYSALAHVALTTDLGATWTDVSGDFPPQPVNAIVVDPSRPMDWYIGTDVSVWHSSNGGTNWMPCETGLPNAVVSDLEIRNVDRKLVAGTHGRGAWELDLPSAANDAAVVVSTSRDLMLDDPAPNPVSDRTMLRFAAKANAEVTLRIYDVKGRLVSQLVEMPTGDGVIRTTPWLTDDVSPGVYFAVLTAGAEKATRKITVLK